MPFVAGDGDDGDARQPVRQRRDERCGVLVGEHADDEVDIGRRPFEMRIERHARIDVVSAVEPDRGVVGKERGERAPCQLLQSRRPMRTRHRLGQRVLAKVERVLAAQHGDGEPGVHDLMVAGKPRPGQGERALGIGIDEMVGAQGDAPVAALAHDRAIGTRGLRVYRTVHVRAVVERDQRRPRLGDARLFIGDAHQRSGGGVGRGGEQELLVVDAQRGDAAGDRVLDHVGRIKPAAKADLEDAGIGGHAREGEEGGGSGCLEEARADVLCLGDVEYLAQQVGQQIVPDQRARDPDALVETLPVGIQQRVEIIKALYRGARILILDEPTAVLTPQEADSLFATLRQLIAEGLSVVFISHKLDEVLRVSHRVAVLRAGKLVAERMAAGTHKAELAELMVGRNVEMPTREASTATRDVVVSLERASVPAAQERAGLHAVSLEIHAGEIVGIAGVSGNGQVALAALLSGAVAATAGRVRVDGKQLPPVPHRWIRSGVARIPEDRHAEGAVGDLAIWENAIAEQLDNPVFVRTGVIRSGAARRFANDLVARFDVRGGGIDTPTRALSGGNMQKLILGRALSVRGTGAPRLVVASQPTWGLDIGAVAYVHRQLLEAAAAGAAVLLISEDLDELMALSDRIAVMHAGHLTAAQPTSHWTLGTLGLAMAGADSARDVSDAEVVHAA